MIYPILLLILTATFSSYVFLLFLTLTLLKRSGVLSSPPTAPPGAPFSTTTTTTLLLVIAHPDDEAMFFTPTLASGYFSAVHILCLSTGDAEGLGRVRAGELVASARSLGVPAERVRVIDHPGLRDGMTTVWDPGAAARQVSLTLNALHPTAVATFDAHGVTGHPNHAATLQAVLDGVRAMAPGPTPHIYTLHSLPAWEKFFFPLHALELLMQQQPRGGPLVGVGATTTTTTSLTFLTPGAFPWAWCHTAMALHWSQYVWHRRLWVAFSSYALVNVLHLERRGEAGGGGGGGGGGGR